MNQRSDKRPTGVRITLIDLECTCDENDFDQHEIIEIGVVTGILGDDAFDPIEELQLYVKPSINPTLTEFCVELTGITQDVVDNADFLPKALLNLQNHLQKHKVVAWTSWGKFDANQFSKECSLKSLKNPLADLQHLNLKQLFARKFGHRVGITRALDLREMKFEGRLHSGLDDTRNIARLVGRESLLREALLTRIFKKM